MNIIIHEKLFGSFENEIKNIEAEIDKLKDPYNNGGISSVTTDRIDKLQSDLDKKLKDIYSNLDPANNLVARHEERPKSKFFIDNLFENFFLYLETDYLVKISHPSQV